MKAAAPGEAGMCAEHGVLEAICTKCNPKLIPVFQAKGDWCAEHGFAESVCPICHPERGGKPAQDVRADGAPADGLRIRFKGKDTAALAGIETVKAIERPNARAIAAPARIAYDATRLARVNARSPGVVRMLHVDIGSQVKKGTPLLAIDSADVGADRARLSAARARIQVAEENLQRATQLAREGISTRTNLLQAQQELDSAKAEHDALAASLSVLGAKGPGLGGYTLTSPLAGTVTERQVNIGRYVSATDLLLEIVDTAEVWAEADVQEADLAVVRAGQTVNLTFDSLPERNFTGTITYVAPAVDPHTRTAKARVPLKNSDGALRANLYGQAAIAAGEARTAVVVPRSAVQRAKGVALAFVKLAANEYETRRVQLGTSDETSYEIVKGVRAGEEVVTTGSFLMKTETLKDSIGAGCCEGE
jgi:cobalt-zinc-cadmium efflux system membrane fusion protein